MYRYDETAPRAVERLAGPVPGCQVCYRLRADNLEFGRFPQLSGQCMVIRILDDGSDDF